jgi:hypothetical protein
VCDSKVNELGAIVGPLGTEALRRLLEGADGDVNRYSTHTFNSALYTSMEVYWVYGFFYTCLTSIIN